MCLTELGTGVIRVLAANLNSSNCKQVLFSDHMFMVNLIYPMAFIAAPAENNVIATGDIGANILSSHVQAYREEMNQE